VSAIGGILRFDGAPVDRADIEHIKEKLRAHGPDRYGSCVLDEIGLVHLLMRMTAEDFLDAQPVQGASGAILVGDLRLDNRDELILALRMDRQQASGLSDAAIVLAAWESWGDNAWARLRGPFAVAIWDKKNRVLNLARDPVGLRTICYHKSKDFFVFATMPKGVFALREVPRALDEQKLIDFLVVDKQNPEITYFTGISRVVPAHIVKVAASGEIRKQRFWGENNIRPVRLKSDEAYAEAMFERLDLAVRRSLRTTHKVGCFLSGGLDSSSVAALAAQAMAEQSGRLSAYTQVPVDQFKGASNARKILDERPLVEAIRDLIGNLDVTYIFSGECDDFADADRIVRAIDGSVKNVANNGWVQKIYATARAADQRVLLGGDMGNITISWNGWDQTLDHLKAGHLMTVWAQIRLYYEITHRSRLGSFRRLILDPMNLDIRRSLKLGHYRWSPANPRLLSKAASIRSGEPSNRGETSSLRFRLDQLEQNDFRGEWEAGALALHGIDLRDPTADLDVVQFCLGIPDEQYLAEGIDRSIIRRAMWGRLPKAVLANRKRGEQSADWLVRLKRDADQIRQTLEQFCGSKEIAEIIDLERLLSLNRSLSEVTDSQKSRSIDEYKIALPKGLFFGSFLRYFDTQLRL
jgi:asparagine synthase (glutamine-hydrolysing)